LDDDAENQALRNLKDGVCIICGKKHFSKSLCRKHYRLLPHARQTEINYYKSDEVQEKRKKIRATEETKEYQKNYKHTNQYKQSQKTWKENHKDEMKKYMHDYHQCHRKKKIKQEIPEEKAETIQENKIDSSNISYYV